MTTAVKIKNVGHGNKVQVKRDGILQCVLDVNEESSILHVWDCSQLTIEELPLDGKNNTTRT